MKQMNEDLVISVRDLSKSYGEVKAVDGLSFDVRRNEIFGMLGPNGAGKTTAMEILETLRSPDSGTATVGGFDIVKDAKRVKEIIGVQLQSSAFFERLRLVETVELYGRAYGVVVNPYEILESVGLEDKAKSYFKQLSGGQKQRLSIAVGLVNKPQILFLDEPTTGLDPRARRNLWKLVAQIRASGTTIMMTSHYMDEAEELCDRLAIMDQGKISVMGSPDDLIDSLLEKGFKSTRRVREATLEDVFIDLTGRTLTDEGPE